MRSSEDLHQDFLDARADEVRGRDLPEAWDDLDQHMIGDELPEVIEDHATAERMLRSIARRRRELEQSERLATAQIERVQEWLESERKRLSTDYFEDCLRTYHASLLAQDDRLKTISLPSGKLKARAGQPRWEISDEFVTWAQEHAPELVRTKVEPDKAAIKKALAVEDGHAISAAGQQVPGVVVEPAEISYRVEVEP